MIELHTALFIAGLVVMLIVVVVSYDRYRLTKMRERHVQTREMELQQDENGTAEEESAVVPRSDFRVQADPVQHTDQPVADNRVEPQLPPGGGISNVRPLGAGEAPGAAGGDAANTPHEPSSNPDTPENIVTGVREDHSPEIDSTAKSESPQVAEAAKGSANSATAAPETTTDRKRDDSLEIEFVARIPGKNVIKRDTALGLYRQYEFDLRKPHRVFGQTHPDKVWMDLETATPQTQFTHFGMTIQLADRSGPVTESELNQFSQMVLRFSEVFGRRFKFSESFEEAMERARQLDELCKKYDSLAILNIVTRDVMFRGREIERHARELGMKLNERRFFEKTKNGASGEYPMFNLANLHGNGEFMPDTMERFTTTGLTLFMNIPCTREPAQTFNEMVSDAKQLCKRLDGKLVDQSQRGMNQTALKRISQHIRQIAADMETDGIVPGSDLALRLF